MKTEIDAPYSSFLPLNKLFSNPNARKKLTSHHFHKNDHKKLSCVTNATQKSLFFQPISGATLKEKGSHFDLKS